MDSVRGNDPVRKEVPELIVMLTYDDHTVLHAAEVFEGCKNSKAKCFGMKELPLPVDEMKKIYARMREYGKTTAMEVVAYSEEEGLAGAKLAAECGCDILMGTLYFASIMEYCKEHHMRYMPYVGEVVERPSILKGTAEAMVQEGKNYLASGAYGINLLGYRYVEDAVELNRTLVSQLPAPVCIAGSVDSYERLDEIKEIGAWGFTIGSAFFDHKFGEDFAEQIDRVCDYMET